MADRTAAEWVEDVQRYSAGRPPLAERIEAAILAYGQQEARRAREAIVASVGKVLADNGCDCDSDDRCGLWTCEEEDHEPCLAHLVERALARDTKAGT